MSSLARKLALKIVALVLVLVLIGGVAIGGLLSMGVHHSAAEDRYEQLRAIYEVGHHAAAAREWFNHDMPDRRVIELHAYSALAIVDQLQDAESEAGRGFSERQRRALDDLRSALLLVADTPDAKAGSVQEALAVVARLAGEIQTQIVADRRAATTQLYTTVGLLAGLLALSVVAAILIGVSQYRSVMGPLGALRRGVSGLTDADFAHRIPEDGDEEFAQVARRFNRMAQELQQLYGSLEAQVEAKSRELVQSERLASVGYLAAGVAHEINNPLGIIGGYAEAAVRDLERGATDPAKSLKALKIIQEEAFRCKQITGKLLELSAPGRAHERVDMGAVTASVVEILRGHKPFRDFDLTCEDRGGGRAVVRANDTEIRQVLLNLVTNALEAVEPEAGRVRVRVDREADDVRVTVEDNGRGMAPELLERIFEPFVTDKPARDRRGLGLGLSVSHAIVESHGGRLSAFSEGVGRGSRFVLILPAADDAPAEVFEESSVDERSRAGA